MFQTMWGRSGFFFCLALSLAHIPCPSHAIFASTGDHCSALFSPTVPRTFSRSRRNTGLQKLTSTVETQDLFRVFNVKDWESLFRRLEAPEFSEFHQQLRSQLTELQAYLDQLESVAEPKLIQSVVDLFAARRLQLKSDFRSQGDLRNLRNSAFENREPKTLEILTGISEVKTVEEIHALLEQRLRTSRKDENNKESDLRERMRRCRALSDQQTTPQQRLTPEKKNFARQWLWSLGMGGTMTVLGHVTSDGWTRLNPAEIQTDLYVGWLFTTLAQFKTRSYTDGFWVRYDRLLGVTRNKIAVDATLFYLDPFRKDDQNKEAPLPRLARTSARIAYNALWGVAMGLKSVAINELLMGFRCFASNSSGRWQAQAKLFMVDGLQTGEQLVSNFLYFNGRNYFMDGLGFPSRTPNTP